MSNGASCMNENSCAHTANAAKGLMPDQDDAIYTSSWTLHRRTQGKGSAPSEHACSNVRGTLTQELEKAGNFHGIVEHSSLSKPTTTFIRSVCLLAMVLLIVC